MTRRGGGGGAVLKIKKKPPASGTLEPPQSAGWRVTAAGHRPTAVHAPTAVR